jgi:hypothetical protein
MRGIGRLFRIALAVLFGLAAAGCHSRPAPGDKCRVPDQLICEGRDRALVCDKSGASASAAPLASSEARQAWVEVTCKGARGCAHAAGGDECDDTRASDADPCPRDPPLDYACTWDQTTALVCKEGRFGLWRRCRGPYGCQVVGGRNIHCDTSLGLPGDPCERSGTFACAVDRQTMLQCDGSALVAMSSCRGADGCSVEREDASAEPHKINCDDRVALEGDPCAQERRITCAVDHKEELVCDGKKFAKKRDCKRSDCRIDGTELFCD